MTKKTIQQMIDEARKNSLINKVSERILNHTIANQAKAEDPEWRQAMAEVQATDEYKRKVSETSKEKWQDDKFREKRKKSLDVWAKSDARKQEVSRQMKGKKKSASHKKNMSKAQKDFYKTTEGKKALQSKSDKQRGQKRPIVICPHCGISGADRIMGRWHFNNCKSKP
jgi:hypothetical protein